MGYYVKSGYMGFADGRWMLFATDTEYYDYLESDEQEGLNYEL